ncbi:hypothetical protein F4604DRAFT_1676379 [Suillus subluteus]|nr:hypothetical protein F4604DRAFT_1676379 [Suillus subluteus]
MSQDELSQTLRFFFNWSTLDGSGHCHCHCTYFTRCNQPHQLIIKSMTASFNETLKTLQRLPSAQAIADALWDQVGSHIEDASLHWNSRVKTIAVGEAGKCDIFEEADQQTAPPLSAASVPSELLARLEDLEFCRYQWLSEWVVKYQNQLFFFKAIPDHSCMWRWGDTIARLLAMAQEKQNSLLKCRYVIYDQENGVYRGILTEYPEGERLAYTQDYDRKNPFVQELFDQCWKDTVDALDTLHKYYISGQIEPMDIFITPDGKAKLDIHLNIKFDPKLTVEEDLILLHKAFQKLTGSKFAVTQFNDGLWKADISDSETACSEDQGGHKLLINTDLFNAARLKIALQAIEDRQSTNSKNEST